MPTDKSVSPKCQCCSGKSRYFHGSVLQLQSCVCSYSVIFAAATSLLQLQELFVFPCCINFVVTNICTCKRAGVMCVYFAPQNTLFINLLLLLMLLWWWWFLIKEIFFFLFFFFFFFFFCLLLFLFVSLFVCLSFVVGLFVDLSH